jgi:hypothetical protein
LYIFDKSGSKTEEIFTPFKAINKELPKRIQEARIAKTGARTIQKRQDMKPPSTPINIYNIRAKITGI